MPNKEMFEARGTIHMNDGVITDIYILYVFIYVKHKCKVIEVN